MNTEEIDILIKEYEAKLKKLQPTLNPAGEIAYGKIGILNSARNKAKQYTKNINLLRVLRNAPDAVPEADLKQILSGQTAPTPQPHPPGTPLEQEGLWEAPHTADTQRVRETIRHTYTRPPPQPEPVMMSYIPPPEQASFDLNPASEVMDRMLGRPVEPHEETPEETVRRIYGK